MSRHEPPSKAPPQKIRIEYFEDATQETCSCSFEVPFAEAQAPTMSTVMTAAINAVKYAQDSNKRKATTKTQRVDTAWTLIFEKVLKLFPNSVGTRHEPK